MNVNKQGLVQRVLIAATVLLIVGVRAVAAPNSVTVRDTSGSGQNNRPFTISRVFAQGEFPSGSYPQASINGMPLTTQDDVKNTWSDGSVKHVLVSFVASITAGGTIVVNFVSQNTPNNNGYMNKSDMLNVGGGTWDAAINTNLASVSARTMLNALPAPSTDINTNQARYWMKGPIVTQVIVEDKTVAFAYDFGTNSNKSLHPIFVLTFYPTTNLGINVQYIVENVWDTKRQDQTYTLTSLTANGSTVYSKASFNYISGSRWRKVFWAGTAPSGWTDETAPGINIDYNLAYMTSTKAIPNYDTAKSVPIAAVNADVNVYSTNNGGEEPQFCITNANYCGSFAKVMNSTGGREEIGLAPTWETRFLYSAAPSLWPVFIGNALASGGIPIHFRETDPTLWYDTAHTVSALGHAISTTARAGVPAPVGTTTSRGWSGIDQAHQPAFAYLPYLITGDWYFLEELYFWAAVNGRSAGTCKDSNWCGGGEFEFINPTLQERGVAWGLRSLGQTAFAAPDGAPEQAHVTQKLNNNLTIWEGVYGITSGSFPPVNAACPGFVAATATDMWCWGNKLIALRSGGGAANPLYQASYGDFYAQGDAACCLDNTKTGFAPVAHPWMVSYTMTALGHIGELGFRDHYILQQYERFFIGMVLDPASSPYYIGGYVYPMVKPNGAWIDTWAGISGAYLSGYDPVAAFNARTGDLDSGYPVIAYAALSYAPGFSVSALTGDAAWAWISTNLPSTTLAGMNGDPKWAIVPRTASVSSTASCDLNGDGKINVVDVQLSINQALGLAACSNGDVDQDGKCTIVDVQRIVNASLGASCQVGP